MNGETLSSAQESETVDPIVNEVALEEEQTENDDHEFSSPDDQPEEVEAEAAESEADGEGEQAAEPELVEIEWEDGQKYGVHPALKDALMRNKDYTQKTQGLAEQRREFEAKQQDLIKREQINQVELETLVEFKAIDTQYADYAQLSAEDWNSLEAEDPIAAQQHWRNFQLLEKQRNEVGSRYQNAQQEKQALLQSEATKRWEATEKFAQESIPGWNKEMDGAIREFAAEQLSFPADQFNAAVNSNVYKALHLAWVGAKTLQKQAQPGSVAAKLKPMSRVTAKSGNTAPTDPSNMSMDDYAAWAAKRFKD